MKNPASALLLIALLSWACQSDYESLHRPADESFGGFVSKELAAKIGGQLRFRPHDKTTNATGVRRRKPMNKKLKAVFPLKDQDGQTDLYILNYQHGGFVLLAADKRMNPILAYSDQNTFPTDEAYPGGLSSWLSAVKQHLKSLRKRKDRQSPERKKQWEALVSSGYAKILSAPRSNPTESNSQLVEQVGPFIASYWEQENGFNDRLPICSEPSLQRFSTGSALIALAQIMRYDRCPKELNFTEGRTIELPWNDMLVSTATNGSKNLMAGLWSIFISSKMLIEDKEKCKLAVKDPASNILNVLIGSFMNYISA